MTDSPADSVFLITSKDAGNRIHGTGFVIRKDGGKTWLLTCRHVVKDVGGPKAVLVNRMPAANVIFKEEGPEDLAVLEVNGMENAPALGLKIGGRKGNPIHAVGFSVFDKKADRYSIKTVEGVLGNPGGQEVGGVSGRVNTWDLDVKGDDHLKEGYSGSPVIDTKTGAVIGVVSHMLGKGDKGVAVSVDALLRVWPDAAPRLIQDAPEEKSEPPKEKGSGTKQRNYGKILALLCNRIDHDAVFRDEFVKSCTDDACRNAPQFYIIHGDAGEAHRSLVERFKQLHIRTFVSQSWREKKLLPHPIEPPWPTRKDLDAHKTSLTQQLIVTVNRSYTGRDYSLKTLLTCRQISAFNIILIRYHITAGKWARHYRELLAWYMKEYWRLDPAKTDSPLFIVFFCIEYPKANIGKKMFAFWDRRNRMKKRIQRELEALVREVNASCRCVLIDEIEPVTRDEVRHWFRTNTGFSNFEIETRVQEIFEDKESISMSVLENRLEKITSKIDQNDFQQYLEGIPL